MVVDCTFVSRKKYHVFTRDRLGLGLSVLMQKNIYLCEIKKKPFVV